MDLTILAQAASNHRFVACPMGLSVARSMGLSEAQATSNHCFVACPMAPTLSVQAVSNH